MHVCECHLQRHAWKCRTCLLISCTRGAWKRRMQCCFDACVPITCITLRRPPACCSSVVPLWPSGSPVLLWLLPCPLVHAGERKSKHHCAALPCRQRGLGSMPLRKMSGHPLADKAAKGWFRNAPVGWLSPSPALAVVSWSQDTILSMFLSYGQCRGGSGASASFVNTPFQWPKDPFKWVDRLKCTCWLLVAGGEGERVSTG